MLDETQTPIMMVFNYIDSMIGDNIDFLELKQKALEMERSYYKVVELRGYNKCLDDIEKTIKESKTNKQ